MIPKIIHYCWLSNDPFPEKIQKCINSWKKYLTDYEIIHWNFERFPRGKSKWVDQAYDNHKYAFAADYIRLYALYNYGGIYLDSDVEVLKSFDDLLDLPYFIGQEQTPSGIEAATMGFGKGNPSIGALLKRYENREFIKPDGSYDILPLPYIIRRYIASAKEYRIINSKEEFLNDPNVMNVFTWDYFSPKIVDSANNIFKINVTENTYSIHHFSGSWCPPDYCKSTKECKKNFIKRIVLAARIFLLNRNDTILLSNSSIAFAMYERFGYKYSNLLVNCVVSENDFKHISTHHELLSPMNMEFIRQRDSLFCDYNDDFYPIVKIKNSDIQICYKAISTRERIKELWSEKNFNSMIKHRMVFVYVNGKISTFDLYMLAFKILMGKRYITI